MPEPNILLTRIDNRLIHGQVGVTWTKTLGANLIVVADDAASTDTLAQELMSMTADSSGAGVRFFTLQRTIDIIGKAAPQQKIFLVVRNPHSARILVEAGVPIKQINVGNMHFSEGKHALSKKVYVDDQEVEDLNAIIKSGVEVYIQDVPGDAKDVLKDVK
ncbi:PTS galactosamine transporter subunit IIB [Lactovum odontotermitis]